MSNLDKTVQEMREMAEFLIDYTYPKVNMQTDFDTSTLKIREVIVDGYKVIIHYNQSLYNKDLVEILRILPSFAPFLPFNLVCKIAKKFLGTEKLYFTEIIKDNCKTYSWSILTRNGEKILPKNVVKNVYEGFEYYSPATKFNL